MNQSTGTTGEPPSSFNPQGKTGDAYPASSHQVSEESVGDSMNVDDPRDSCAVFVVHGMGDPEWAETATTLRSGLTKAFDAVAKWRQKHLPPSESKTDRQKTFHPPYIHEGYWADYPEFEIFFSKDRDGIHDRQRGVTGKLLDSHSTSASTTYRWFVKQQFRLLNPAVIFAVGPIAWILYWPLTLITLATLSFAHFRYRKLLEAYLADVRLYLDPQNDVEKTIVQEIDHRVGREFLRMIGLDSDFRRLRDSQLIGSPNGSVIFKRVVWVAHSLGSVISYNVLSDLFHRAEVIEKEMNEEQQSGVLVFRESLRRFITMGSPLDKVAYLFKKRSLKPWPKGARRSLLNGGETLDSADDPIDREWWVNLYHIFDPVSGALSNKLICGNEPPTNLHIGFRHLPGLAHIAYWKDLKALRLILARTFGREFLHDREYRHWPVWLLAILASLSHLVWGFILGGSVYGIYRVLHWVVAR